MDEISPPETALRQQRWYALFSRGERDWLRHNDKVREAVRAYLPSLMESPDLITGAPDRAVKVPLHLLEHARFRLADPPGGVTGAGQGAGRPGDMLQAGRDGGGADGGRQNGAGSGGSDAGGAGGVAGGSGGDGPDGAGIHVQLEFAIGDIIDSLWEEMRLPLLEPRPAPGREMANARSGWGAHGPPSQLDRRRTVKQAVKRRAAASAAVPAAAPAALPAFANADLRYHQHVPRPRAASAAVVLCGLDVSASMTLPERKLAKTFFYFALQGLRRQYGEVAVRFIAHTTRAWEFPEQDFFQIAGEGGTQASSAFDLARQLVRCDYGGGRHNVYLFYASDGENYSEDRVAASQALGRLAPLLNYMGYLETVPGVCGAEAAARSSELHRLFQAQRQAGHATGISLLNRPEDVWKAIRCFFVHAAQEAP